MTWQEDQPTGVRSGRGKPGGPGAPAPKGASTGGGDDISAAEAMLALPNCLDYQFMLKLTSFLFPSSNWHLS